ncbi:hypothetical protein GGC65_003375 [Sphingopyxis sp. OAS728]|uniref:hypothetical protein n=1 Tax=Sphingopyxis sp. OAS728 TaxID=2663823 RepID=UPI00178979E8|nr:hypothetical protein [Sphingopyxis sp. OAS728]MBE1528919.1 hypothetical protein [Sphingopyxis sp. OAS728]
MIDLRTASAALAMLVLTTGCSRTDNEPGPGGVTVSEAKALDDAAEMLESRDSISPPETGKAAEEPAKTGK